MRTSYFQLVVAELFIAIMSFQCGSLHAQELLSVQHLAMTKSDITSDLTLHENAKIETGRLESELRLPNTSYAEWTLEQALGTDEGTLSMWIKPLWSLEDQGSHAIATFKWSGDDESYFALSQGWWEPQDQRKLYVVLSNQQFLFCLTPWKFDYAFFLKDQWTMLAATWQSGNPGYVRLFIDGKQICERKAVFAGGRNSLDPVYLGSDRGAGVEHRGRASEIIIKNLVAANRAFTNAEIRQEYISGGGGDRSKWMRAITADTHAVPVKHERRLIFDEDTHWASSKLEILQRLKRIKAAGFNVYVPCVWDGAKAYFSSIAAPVSPVIGGTGDLHYDPLNYLISQAHKEGIEVYPWIVVARRAGMGFPASYTDGAPNNAFNVQSEQFRNFIVALVLDVVQRYDVDGINLDYVRAIGPCTSETCIDSYQRKYARSLLQDWQSQERGETVSSLIEWNRSAVTDIVKRISVSVREVKPNAILTIDTVPFDHGREHQGMDEAHWLRDGLIDMLVDMAYDDPVDVDTLDHAMRTFSATQQIVAVRNYDVIGDIAIDRSGAVMSDYVQLIRARWPGAGIALYHYPHLSSDQVLKLRRDVFSELTSLRRTH